MAFRAETTRDEVLYNPSFSDAWRGLFRTVGGFGNVRLVSLLNVVSLVDVMASVGLDSSCSVVSLRELLHQFTGV